MLKKLVILVIVIGVAAWAITRPLTIDPFDIPDLTADTVNGDSRLPAPVEPRACQHNGEDLPAETLVYLLGSRYSGAGPARRLETVRRALQAAAADDGGWVLDGTKLFVPYASVADRILVVARTAGARGDAERAQTFYEREGYAEDGMRYRKALGPSSSGPVS